MPLTKTERRVLALAFKRLGPDANIASELRPHIHAIRLYLDTWVIPQIEIVLAEPADEWERFERKRCLNIMA